MSSSHKGRWRSAAALVVGGALTLAGAVPSQAADTTTIDPERSASLTVHKYEQPLDGSALPSTDGTELGASELGSLTALAGVEFTVQQVPGVDLTTNSGWVTAQAMTEEAAGKAVEGVTGTSTTTASDGTAVFADLPLGLYYVTETGTPTGVRAGAPFLVTLPMTDVSGSGWLYDVHVYPKNSVTTADKTVDDSTAVTLGDDVVWTITSSVPVDGTDGYQVRDTLDERLAYKDAVVAIGDTVLVADTDYTLTDATDKDTGRTTVTIKLTEAGLAVANAHKGGSVSVVLTTTVIALGEIENYAEIFDNQSAIDSDDPSNYTPGHPEDPDTDPDNPICPDPPVTKFGTATVSKVDAVSGAALAGAEFKVYRTEADAKAGTNPITISGVSTWTSDDKGLLTISGLRYSNWLNGTELAEGSWQHYYLVETKAPDGYELLAAPVEFDVVGADTTVLAVTVQDVVSDAGFTLPLTGGAGIALLMIGGAGLVVGALMIAGRRGRRGRRSVGSEAAAAQG